MTRILSLVFRHYVQAVLAGALLVSPAAHAGQSRGLSLATAEAPAPNASHAADTTKAPPPAQVAEPECKVSTASGLTTEARPVKKHRSSAEARIIYELHRHGIYW